MYSKSYSGMNGLQDRWLSTRETGIRKSKNGNSPAPWEGDWRLAIAEERVTMAQAKLAAAEQRVLELVEAMSH